MPYVVVCCSALVLKGSRHARWLLLGSSRAHKYILKHESDSSFSSEILPTVGADMRIPRDKAAAPRSKTSTDMESGSFTQNETLTAGGSSSVVTVSSGSAESLPKRMCSDTSRARPRLWKGPVFFDEDDRHLNDTPVIAMDTEWGGEESSGFSSTTGSEEADFHANFCRFRGRRKSSACAARKRNMATSLAPPDGVMGGTSFRASAGSRPRLVLPYRGVDAASRRRVAARRRRAQP